MYFWRINDLRAQLSAGPLPQRQALAYYIPFLVLMTLSGIPHARPAATPTAVLLYTIPAVSGWIFIWRAYVANGGNAGVDFLARLFALSWVRGVRLVVKVLVPFIAVAILVIKPLLIYWAGFHSQFILENQASIPFWSSLIGALIGIALAIFFLWKPVLNDFRGVSGSRS